MRVTGNAPSNSSVEPAAAAGWRQANDFISPHRGQEPATVDSGAPPNALGNFAAATVPGLPAHAAPADAPADEAPPGKATTSIGGLGHVPSYTGDLPSPLQLMWYAPEGNELLKAHFPDTEIRSWVEDAAAYNDVPHEMLAVVLQQENAPSASKLRQFLQFGERSVHTFAAIVDQLPFSPVPDAIAGGSSGIANMKRETLRSGAEYVENTYGRPALPDDVQYRAFGWDQDTRIPGDDLKADLYYSSGVLRHLIDREMGAGYRGPLTLEQTERIIASYNGSGPLAEKYGRDAMAALRAAADGSTPLYFYEK